MKTKFGNDLNGIYLDIEGSNDDERRLLTELLELPQRELRHKLKVFMKEGSNSISPSLRIQNFRYVSSREPYYVLANLVEVTDKYRFYKSMFTQSIYAIRGSFGGMFNVPLKVYKLDVGEPQTEYSDFNLLRENGKWYWTVYTGEKKPVLGFWTINTLQELYHYIK